MGQLYAYLLLCSTLVLAAYADVSLYPTDETEASCGEKTTIECTATATNSVTITAKNDSFVFGVHTYERGSAREAKAGTLDLYLAQASVSAENPFLTNFRVIASENYMGKVTIMSCADVNAVQLVKIRTKPTQCSLTNVQLMDIGNNTKLIEWEEPNCEGWRQLSYYTLVIVEGGEERYATANEPSTIVSGQFSRITITATNVCGETTSIAIVNNENDGEKEEEEKQMYNKAGGGKTRGGSVLLTTILLGATRLLS